MQYLFGPGTGVEVPTRRSVDKRKRQRPFIVSDEDACTPVSLAFDPDRLLVRVQEALATAFVFDRIARLDQLVAGWTERRAHLSLIIVAYRIRQSPRARLGTTIDLL
jgi:hypothetical protein